MSIVIAFAAGTLNNSALTNATPAILDNLRSISVFFISVSLFYLVLDNDFEVTIELFYARHIPRLPTQGQLSFSCIARIWAVIVSHLLFNYHFFTH